MDVSFLRITKKDRDFLLRVFASAFEEQMAVANLTAVQRSAFVEGQFKAQHASYRSKFPKASYHIVLADGEPVGRFYVNRSRDEIRILDLIILPDFRNAGIGTELIAGLCSEAAENGQSVGVHIPKGWRSHRLALRLGFRRQLVTEHTEFMSWEN